jgi:hypothetical protein
MLEPHGGDDQPYPEPADPPPAPPEIGPLDAPAEAPATMPFNDGGRPVDTGPTASTDFSTGGEFVA